MEKVEFTLPRVMCSLGTLGTTGDMENPSILTQLVSGSSLHTLLTLDPLVILLEASME